MKTTSAVTGRAAKIAEAIRNKAHNRPGTGQATSKHHASIWCGVLMLLLSLIIYLFIRTYIGSFIETRNAEH